MTFSFSSVSGMPDQAKSELKLVEFYHPYWPVCQQMEPIVHRVKKKYEKRLRGFEILDVRSDEGEEKVEKYGIAYTPTFVLLDKDGKERDRIIGKVEQKILEKFIEGNIERLRSKEK